MTNTQYKILRWIFFYICNWMKFIDSILFITSFGLIKTECCLWYMGKYFSKLLRYKNQLR
jgi:hypothetical protein